MGITVNTALTTTETAAKESLEDEASDGGTYPKADVSRTRQKERKNEGD